VDEVIGKIGALLVGNRTFRGDDPYKGDATTEGKRVRTDQRAAQGSATGRRQVAERRPRRPADRNTLADSSVRQPADLPDEQPAVALRSQGQTSDRGRGT
jgi:hypothetical protein